jgi:predicted XRE-type DNA-binding protein
MTMVKIQAETGSGNVFADLGFSPADADELTAKSDLIIAIKDIVHRRKLTQRDVARLCGTDQPTLSKVFRGRMESVTLDRLTSWLTALGQDVEIIIRPVPSSRREGRVRVVAAARGSPVQSNHNVE